MAKITKAKTTKAKPVKAKAKTPAKKKVVATFDWNNVGENVMRNAEQISANIRKNAERIGNNVRALMDR